MHSPDNDGGVVVILLHHLAVHSFAAGEHDLVSQSRLGEAAAPDGDLGPEGKTALVKHIEEDGMIRVMGAANRVAAHIDGKVDVAPHQCGRERQTVLGVILMAVDASYLIGLAVEEQLAVLHLHPSEAYAVKEIIGRGRNTHVVE